MAWECIKGLGWMLGWDGTWTKTGASQRLGMGPNMFFPIGIVSGTGVEGWVWFGVYRDWVEVRKQFHKWSLSLGRIKIAREGSAWGLAQGEA